MKTPCRIENVNKCSNESCRSMILRSACSHGHSHASLASDDVRIQNSDKKRISKSTEEGKASKINNSKNLFQFKTYFESSLKQITLKSTRTNSDIKENLYERLDFSENKKDEQNGRTLKSVPEHLFIKTSTPISSSFVHNSFITSGECFGDDHSSESLEVTMSGRNLERRPLRALSDSEDEDPHIESRARLNRSTRSSSAISHSSSSTNRFVYTNSSNHLKANNFTTSTPLTHGSASAEHLSNNNDLTNEPLNLSQLNRSLVQESRFDRLRWRIWRNIYLAIISWISFDVWLLSRLRSSKIALLLLLLPLLTYLSYVAVISADFPTSFTIPSILSEPSQSYMTIAEKPDFFNSLSALLPSLSAISGFFSAAFEKSTEETSYISPPSQEQPCKQSLAVEDLEVLRALVKRLQLDQKIQASNTQAVQSEMAQFQKEMVDLRQQVKDWNGKLETLEASIEGYLVAAFRRVVVADKTSPYFFFSEWVNSTSVELKIMIENLRKEIVEQDTTKTKVIEGLVRHYLESQKVSQTCATPVKDSSNFGEHLWKIVQDEILKYNADKTGLTDYALESSGGSVISIRCTESYTEKRGTISLFGLPLWSAENSPRIAIQPDVHPGRCWSFKGSQGFLVIQLSYAIRPTGFTLEHIPASISPTGSIDSAPREFSVWGLSSETDEEGQLLGHYAYDDKGLPWQYFAVQQNSDLLPTSYVELKIHSNHGNMEYTCLYRFRVHGIHVK